MKPSPTRRLAVLGLLAPLLAADLAPTLVHAEPPRSAARPAPVPGAVVAPAQDPGIVPPAEDEAARKKHRRREREVERLYAQLDQMADVWEDEAAVERGREELVQLLEAAGGLEAWQALGGLRLQVLEARKVLTHRDPDKWELHHYVPRLAAFTLDGNGYLFSEFAEIRNEEARASYLRQVATGDLGWTEKEGNFFRGTRVAELALAAVRRQFLMNAMPFSLHGLGARLAFSRTDEVEDPETGETIKHDIYLMRVPRDVGLIMESRELITEFVLVVDPVAERVVQLQYILNDDDRDSLEIPYTRAYVGFRGQVPVGGVRLPAETSLWHEDPIFTLTWEVAEPVGEELAPEALRRPWLGNPVYAPPHRADHWDPPPEDEAEPAGEGSAAGGAGAGEAAGGSGR